MIAIIIGLAGAIGTGKSFTQLQQALQYANDRQRQLVCNFELNLKELYKYACMPKHADSITKSFLYELSIVFPSILTVLLPLKRSRVKAPPPRLPWIKYLIENGGIIQIPAPKSLQALLIPNSVVCLDEAGILLNSRDFASTPRELLADLAQSRKFGCDLFWCAQFEEQVDKQIRLLTQYWIHCDSLAVFDKKLKRPRLFWKKIFWFRAADYMQWLSNVKDRSSHFKTRFAYSFKYQGGLLTPSDKQLFKVFDSFTRLDRSSSEVAPKIVSLERCPLPSDYYFKRLLNYCPQLDPFSNLYQREYGFFSRSKRVEVFTAGQSLLVVADRSSLIRRALALAKAQGISAPYFKSMADAEIQRFISSHSS